MASLRAHDYLEQIPFIWDHFVVPLMRVNLLYTLILEQITPLSWKRYRFQLNGICSRGQRGTSLGGPRLQDPSGCIHASP